MRHAGRRLLAGLLLVPVAAGGWQAMTSAQTSARPPQRDAQRAAATGSAVIAGRVVAADDSGQPVRRVTVSASGSALSGTRLILTDDDGRFVIADLPAGTYQIRATKDGWLPGYLGSRNPWQGPGVPLAVGEGEQQTALEIQLTPGAAVSGRISDQMGRPQAGARVLAMTRRRVGGRVTYAPVATSSSIARQTDDRGTFRLYGLPPGDYIIGAGVRSTNRAAMRLTTEAEVRWAEQLRQGTQGSAPPAPPEGPPVDYTPVYYPGVTDPAAATIVTLGVAEDRTGLDFPMQFIQTSTISGTLAMPDGAPAMRAMLMLVPKVTEVQLSSLLSGSPLSNRAGVDANGHFTFDSVPPGDYTVMAQAPSAPIETPRPGESTDITLMMDLWANQEVFLSGQDVTGLSLILQPGLTVSGRVTFEGVAEPPPPATVSVALRPADQALGSVGGVASARAGDDGTFTLEGVVPGRYVLTPLVRRVPGRDADWIPLEAIVGGTNILFEPFDIRPGGDLEDVSLRFTDQAAEITGTITDGAGRPVQDLSIMLFAADPARWSTELIRTQQYLARPDQTGRFTLERLQPGDYYMAALGELNQTDLTDPAFLEEVAAGAIPITLALGEHKTQDIRLAGGGG